MNPRSRQSTRALVLATSAALLVLAGCASGERGSASDSCPPGSYRLLGGGGCAAIGQSDPQQSSTTAVPTTTTSLAPTTTTISPLAALQGATRTSSAIEGFPVPSVATADGAPETKKSLNGFTSTSAKYRVPGVSRSSVLDWYSKQQIPFKDFGRWKWCESFQNLDWWWKLPSSVQMLGYTVDDAAGSAVITVMTENSGTSPCLG
jgi:hypothetical protein